MNSWWIYLDQLVNSWIAQGFAMSAGEVEWPIHEAGICHPSPSSHQVDTVPHGCTWFHMVLWLPNHPTTGVYKTKLVNRIAVEVSEFERHIRDSTPVVKRIERKGGTRQRNVCWMGDSGRAFGTSWCWGCSTDDLHVPRCQDSSVHTASIPQRMRWGQLRSRQQAMLYVHVFPTSVDHLCYLGKNRRHCIFFCYLKVWGYWNTIQRRLVLDLLCPTRWREEFLIGLFDFVRVFCVPRHCAWLHVGGVCEKLRHHNGKRSVR